MKLQEIFVNEKSKIKDAMKTIDCGGLGIALVVDKHKKLKGVVTDSDIRRAVMTGINIDHEVRKIMNIKPIKINEKYTKLDIDNLLLEINKKKFPVYGTLCVPVVSKKGEIKDFLFISEKGYKGKLSDSKIDVKKVNRILVVGGAGYLGGILCRKLLNCGYCVRVLDNLMYGDDGIKHIYHHHGFEFINGDIRDLRTVVKAINDVDAVIHLAAIVGDPASALDPRETIEINYLSSIILAEVCKQSQINRFIFASTCSIYGASESGKMLNETSKLNPVSLYAEMKLKSEQGILSMEDDNFSPTVLRMGTLFGVAPRMRFDLVINILCAKAIMERKFAVFGGSQWRAFCHVEDAAEAYITCLEAPIR
ncbi:MAG: NAD-dependent epimerase/dehydratase family protein, partial [Thermoplasmata archaeon]|nr:NAD-dependent epimerase/dehydratase family protein [Thermoplasmata archaeon]